MDQITSPDLPAWFCYLLVLSLGMLVARANVNRLLASQPGHWGFANTWALFWAHATVPVILFWFLDYTSVLRDSALFGALVVTFGYRQIFAGGIQGITMPGQTPRLWQPFEAWVGQIKDRIATDYKDSRDLFDVKVRTYLASDAARMQDLRGVCFTYTQDPVALATPLAALAAQVAPSGAPPQSFDQWRNNEEVRILLNDLRKSQPASYGLFLYQNGLITRWMYLNWRQSRQSKFAGWVVAIVIGVAIGVGAWACYQNQWVAFSYYQWRLTKVGASNREHFRSHEYLARHLEAAAQAKPADFGQIRAIVSPLILRLHFRDTAPQTADDILALLIDAHSPATDRVVIPPLIEALRNPNEDLRLRIRRALSGLQQADYPETLPEDLADKWVPAKDESAVDIDRHVQAWQTWWRTAQPPPNP
jgi:hypothetical protein